MDLIGHGIDIIECERIKQVWDRHGDRFLRRVFTPSEIQYCLAKKNPLPHLAGRFAAKEAVLKVLGTGWRGAICWTDVEVTHAASGQPIIALTGDSARIAREMGIRVVQISITHTQHYAAASAIGLGVRTAATANGLGVPSTAGATESGMPGAASAIGLGGPAAKAGPAQP